MGNAHRKNSTLKSKVKSRLGGHHRSRCSCDRTLGTPQQPKQHKQQQMRELIYAQHVAKPMPHHTDENIQKSRISYWLRCDRS
ncbi:hypothetical protein SPB21_02540 [Leptothoe sp. ISB3NOV94-8A]